MAFPYRVVALTGASTGLGAEMARQLGQAGCRVALIARTADKLQTVAETVRSAGGEALVLPCNVDDWPAMQQAVARIEIELGPIECMIANAGVGQTMLPGPWEPTNAERIIRTNYLGMINSLYAVLPAMEARGRGHLVGIASMASYQGIPMDAGYSASKAAQRIFLEGLRVQMHGTGIRVTCICPGFVRTPMTDKNDFDMPFLLEPEDACRRMLRAIQQKRRVFNYPKRLRALVWLGVHSPRWAYDRVVAAAARKKTGRKQAFSDGRMP